MNKTLNMTKGSPLKLLLVFALPLMLGNVFQQMYTVVDTAIVGRGVGLTALAALGTVDWLNWMFIGIAQGFTQGFSVKIAQKFGEGDASGVRRYAAHSARLSIIIALGGVIFAEAALPAFLWLLRVPSELYPMAELYSRIIMGGFPAVVFFNYCSAMLRAVGDSKTPLLAMVAASFTNIVLDLIAVFVLGWGIAGAAAATVFSQVLAGTVCAVRMTKTKELRFSRKQMGKDRALSADLMRIGTPMALKNLIISVGGIAVTSVVNGFSMSFIAGFTATNKLFGILEIAAISYGYAVTTYIGQNFGAGLFERIKRGMRAAVILSLLTSLVIALIMFLFGRQITMLFIAEEDPLLVAAAGDTAYLYLRVMSVCLPVLYMLHAFMAALQGLGNTVGPMISGIIEFVLRVVISVVVGFTSFSFGIFLAEVSAWFGAAGYMGIVYYRDMYRLCKKAELSANVSQGIKEL